MGSTRRLRKLYEIPKKIWDSKRIEEESKLIDDFGLRNMHELWRMQTILRKIRREARKLLAQKSTSLEGRKSKLTNRVKILLIPKADVTLDDILALSVKDILERRLQTVVLRKGLATSSKQARQIIVHGHIGVNGQKSTSPSMLVSFSQEAQVDWFGKPLTVTDSKSIKQDSKSENSKQKHEMPAAENQTPAAS